MSDFWTSPTRESGSSGRELYNRNSLLKPERQWHESEVANDNPSISGLLRRNMGEPICFLSENRLPLSVHWLPFSGRQKNPREATWSTFFRVQSPIFVLVREKRREWMGCWGLLGLLLLLSQSRSPEDRGWGEGWKIAAQPNDNHSDNSSDTSTISYHTRL